MEASPRAKAGSNQATPSIGDPLDLRHDALVVLVALRVAVGQKGVLGKKGEGFRNQF